jgi:hypothetical protein
MLDCARSSPRSAPSRRPSGEKATLLVAYAQDALDHQERAARQLAEAEAKQKRLEEAYALDRNARAWWDRGGGLQ